VIERVDERRLSKIRGVIVARRVLEAFPKQSIRPFLEFYEKALGLTEQRRITPPDQSFTIVYVGNEESEFQLELTELKDHQQKYDLGECEFHLAFRVDDFEAEKKLHSEMDCICFENKTLGIYFISDPDGYWLEIIPTRK